MPAVRRKAPASSRSSGVATPPRPSGVATLPRPSGMVTPPRPSGMATGSSSSRGPTVTSPFNPWSKYYAQYQSDTDSTLQNSTTSYSSASGTCTEDTISDAANSMGQVTDLPPELYKIYQGLAPIASYSREELMKLVSCSPYSNNRHALIIPFRSPSIHVPRRTSPLCNALSTR